MSERYVSLEYARDFARDTLVQFNTSKENASCVADALVAAEADGLTGHGLSRLPSYSAQAKTKKADGHAVPELSLPKPGTVFVDAMNGFAYPALRMGSASLVEAALANGIAMLGVTRSNHCGVAGHHVEKLSRRGLIAMMFANAPASIAPWGGSRALFGTNPLAFACPQKDREPVIVDLSVSKVARGNLLAAAQRSEPIPEGWALDTDGQPTTDAKAGLEGTMLPMGDAKGTALALMVEVLAATLLGANQSYNSSSFFNGEGDPPGTGQLMIGIDPFAFQDNFLEKIAKLILAIEEQTGARVPGHRRFENRKKSEQNGVMIPHSLMRALKEV